MKSVIAIPFARKLSGRTNYRRRLALLKSNLPRLVVRKTAGAIILQLVEFGENGDKVPVTITSARLKKFGWKHSLKNIPAAYLSGMLFGKAALSSGKGSAVPDIGLQSVTKGGKIFAALKGAKDAGMDIPLSDDIAPPADAISGGRVAAYAKVAGGSQFARAKTDAARIAEDFEKVKADIAGNKGLHAKAAGGKK